MGQQRQKALAYIRQQLVSGSLKPGETFSEKQISEETGFSRTPIREAVAVLSARGFLKQIPQVGVQVRVLTTREMNELLRCRLALEEMVMSELCQVGMTGETSQQLVALVDQMEVASHKSDREKFLGLDTDFHLALLDAAKFSFVSETLSDARDLMRIHSIDIVSRGGELPTMYSEHEQLLEAVMQRDESKALRLLRSHLSQALLREQSESEMHR